MQDFAQIKELLIFIGLIFKGYYLLILYPLSYNKVQLCINDVLNNFTPVVFQWCTN